LSAFAAQKDAGMTMKLPLPTIAEIEKFAEQVRACRKATAEKLLQDRVMTRKELIEHGFLSDKDVN